MAQIVDLSDLVSLLTDGQVATLNAMISNRTGGGSVVPEMRYMHRDWRVAGAAATSTVAGSLLSYWPKDGTPGPGAVPTTWVNPINTTPGALQQIDPTGGRKKFLSYVSMFSERACTMILYDRLGHMGGMDGTVTTAQNTNGGSPATITRYTNGARNWAWLEIYTAIGATARTFTASYTNQSNDLVTSTATVVGATGSLAQGQCIPFQLAAGDTGVRAVTSVTLSATTGTAGNFGVTIGRPLMALGTSGNGGGVAKCYLDGSIPEIVAGACLGLMISVPTTGTALADLWCEMVEA